VSPVTRPAATSSPASSVPAIAAASRATPARPDLDALVHSALLEAVRALDAPSTDLELDLFDELRNKRLGLSETVQAQARRYAEAVRRGARLPFAEAVALARLVRRRPDAEAVFREAGRHLAQVAAGRVGGLTRWLARRAPAALARPLALRTADRIARRYLQGSIRREGAAVLLDVPQPVTLDASPGAAGTAFYDAAFRELLDALGQDVGVIDRVACRTRGDRSCTWRTEWKR
jgi:hypothetical protein